MATEHKNINTQNSSQNPPPFQRRLIAMLYDFLLGGFLASLTGAIISWILIKKGLTIPADSPLAYSIFAMELFVGFLYFQWFCLHKGQTLGMRIWEMKIANLQGDPVSYTQVLIRYFSLVGIMLIGFLLAYKVMSYPATVAIGVAALFLAMSLLWSYLNHRKLVLHEAISGTQLIDCRT